MSGEPVQTRLLVSGSGPTIAIGSLGDRFVVGEVIGRGGMGEVLTAHERELDRQVAMKRLGPDAERPHARVLVEEARLQGRLDHPSIPPVFDLGTDAAGRPAFAMRRVVGDTMALRLARAGRGRERLRDREVFLRWFVEVSRAIDHAHARGVAHCDLKPSNVMIDADHRVYVIDWGVATTFGGDEPGAQRRAGATLGYMAPEQHDAAGVIDGRTDVYALGCILFEILCGEPLHVRGPGLLQSVLRGPDARLQLLREPAAAVPAVLVAACERALATAPSDRFARAGELAAEVESWLDRSREQAALQARAADHLARARAAAAEPDQHALALAEAGHALALDPDDAETLALVRSLLAGEHAPAEVAHEMEALDDALDRRLARTAAWSYPGFLLLPLALLFQGRAAWLAIIASMAAWGALEALAILAARGRAPRGWPYASLFLIAGQTLLYTRYLGPFAIAPGIAALCCAGALLHPRLRRPTLVIAVLLAPLATAALLEALGVWSPTTAFAPGALMLSSTVSELHPATTAPMLAAIAAALQVVGALIGTMVAAPAHAARRSIAVHAWHLDELVGPGRRGERA